MQLSIFDTLTRYVLLISCSTRHLIDVSPIYGKRVLQVVHSFILSGGMSTACFKVISPENAI